MESHRLVFPRARYFVKVCRLRKRKRTSHPSGFRLMERGPSLRPLADEQPQKIFGTRPCPITELTDPWFPA